MPGHRRGLDRRGGAGHRAAVLPALPRRAGHRAAPGRLHLRRLRLDRLPHRRVRGRPLGAGAWPAEWADRIEYRERPAGAGEGSGSAVENPHRHRGGHRTGRPASRAAGLPAVDLGAVVAEQDDPLVFATVSGAHLYGFPSRDSDVDLRGAHLLPAAALLGLHEPDETRTRMWDRGRTELDLVIARPAQVRPAAAAPQRLRAGAAALAAWWCTPLAAHDELIALAPGRAHRPPRPPLPGLRHDPVAALREDRRAQAAAATRFRVLLTGIHLDATAAEVQPHLPTLVGEAGRARLHAGADRGQGGGRARHGRVRWWTRRGCARDVEALHAAVLDAAQDATALPDAPGVREALHDLIVRPRTAGASAKR